MSKQGKKVILKQALRKFRIIYGSVRHHFREVEQSCGVSGSQLWILQEVRKTPGIGISELAECLSIHPSTCSLLVEKLAAHDFIIKERSKEDQRRVGLWLTRAATELLKKAPVSPEGILPEALSALSGQTLQALDDALNEVVGQMHIRNEKFADKPLSEL